jgi:hypothetical protein
MLASRMPSRALRCCSSTESKAPVKGICVASQ